MHQKLENGDFHIIEDFIDQEYAKHLSDYFIENQLQDTEREFYGYLTFGGHAEFFEEDFRLQFDPLDKIKEMNHFAYKYFVDNYNIKGNFSLNRSHANLMRVNAELYPHEDDRYFGQPVEDLGSTTYVASFVLNDDYKGGELVFGQSEITIKPKAGSLVLFPGYKTRHAVNKVTSGTRVNTLSHFFDIVDESKMDPRYQYKDII